MTTPDRYSVIIPTMWVSSKIKNMLKVYEDSNFVKEIIIIDNNPQYKRHFELPSKVRILTKGKNIYVNPAWNLGIKESKEDNVIIANDDIFFENLDALLSIIKLENKMLIGVSPNCLKKIKLYNQIIIPPDDDELRIEFIQNRPYGYGIFMILKKESYIVIPEDLLIWEGDDIQFENNDTYCIRGIKIDTEMSETIKAYNLTSLATNDVSRRRAMKKGK